MGFFFYPPNRFEPLRTRETFPKFFLLRSLGLAWLKEYVNPILMANNRSKLFLPAGLLLKKHT